MADDVVEILRSDDKALPSTTIKGMARSSAKKGNASKMMEVVDIDEDDDVVELIIGPNRKEAPARSNDEVLMVMKGDDNYGDFPSICQHCNQDDDGMVRLGHCRHVVCLTCLKAPHMNKALPPTEPIRCPVQGCQRPLLAASDVLHILTPTSYDHYKKNQLKAFVDHTENCWEGKEGAFACPQCSGIPSNVEKEAPSTSSASKNDSEASPAAASKPSPAAAGKSKKRGRGGGKEKEGAAAAATAIDVEEEAEIITVPKEDDTSLPRPQLPTAPRVL